jgi:EpsI family protein
VYIKNRSFPVLLLFILTCIAIYAPRPIHSDLPSVKLEQHFKQLREWESLDLPLEDSIVASLALDDYLSRAYMVGNNQVDLYIGYYNSPVGNAEAHSPLICFPGQGWTLSGEHVGNIRIVEGPRSVKPLTCKIITATKSNIQMRVLFWYQAHEGSFANTLQQKLAILWNSIRYNKGGGALVRVSVLMQEGDEHAADSILENFLQVFYPYWLSYLRAETGSPNH